MQALNYVLGRIYEPRSSHNEVFFFVFFFFDLNHLIWNKLFRFEEQDFHVRTKTWGDLGLNPYRETRIGQAAYSQFVFLIDFWGWLECLTPRFPVPDLGGVLGIFVFEEWSSSNEARTSTIPGLCLGSVFMHCDASAATAWAPFLEYWPPNLISMILETRLLSFRNGLAQSTRVSCKVPGLLPSITRLPVSNSTKTTPKLYTSLLKVKWPV